jgi:hypothetical protein
MYRSRSKSTSNRSVSSFTEVIPKEYESNLRNVLSAVLENPSLLDDMQKFINERLNNDGKSKFLKMCKNIKTVSRESIDTFIQNIKSFSKELSTKYQKIYIESDSRSGSDGKVLEIENPTMGGRGRGYTTSKWGWGTSGARRISGTLSSGAKYAEMIMADLEENPIDSAKMESFFKFLMFFFVLLFLMYSFTKVIEFSSNQLYKSFNRTRRNRRSAGGR